jgi:hypothetical protein
MCVDSSRSCSALAEVYRLLPMFASSSPSWQGLSAKEGEDSTKNEGVAGDMNNVV